MKYKFGFLFILLFLLVGSIYGQRFRAGLTGGLVASDLVGIDPSGLQFRKAGFSAGGIVDARMSERNSFYFEIAYTQKGSLRRPNDSTNNTLFYQLKLNYIEVPLIFKHHLSFHMGKTTIDHFSLEMGLSLGSLISVSQSDAYNNLFDNSKFKRSEVAGIIGLDYLISHNLSANIRFSNSLIPVVEKDVDYPVSLLWFRFNNGHNMAFYFSLRYLFGAVPE